MAHKFIQQAIKQPGAFTAKAKSRGLTPAKFQAKVLASPKRFDVRTVRQANLRKTLVGKKVGGKRRKRRVSSVLCMLLGQSLLGLVAIQWL